MNVNGTMSDLILIVAHVTFTLLFSDFGQFFTFFLWIRITLGLIVWVGTMSDLYL